MVIQVQDWIAAGHAADANAHEWNLFFQHAPWVFLLAVLALLAQALRNRRRYLAVDVLSANERDQLRDKIASIETRTAAEIVPLVVERSDRHTHTLLLGAACFALIANLCLLRFLPQERAARIFTSEIALLLIGLGFTRLCPDYRRWFLTRARAEETAGEQALVEMARMTHGQKDAPPLVLLFVSLFEHRIIVLASEPVAGAVDGALWPDTVAAVQASVRRGRLAEGLMAGMEKCSLEMQRAFPGDESNQNRYSDRAITRRE